jgi:hypothetical protein
LHSPQGAAPLRFLLFSNLLLIASLIHGITLAFSTDSKVFLLLLQKVSENSGAQQNYSASLAVRFDQRFPRLLAQFSLELASSIRLSSHNQILCICVLPPPSSNPQV